MTLHADLEQRVSTQFTKGLRDFGLLELLVRRREDGYRAFVKRGELCLAVVPRFLRRHGAVKVESYIALISEKFERLCNCVPFDDCSFQTFGIHSANIAALRRSSFVSADREMIDLEAALGAYQSAISNYPSTSAAMMQSIQSGQVLGVPIGHFSSSGDLKSHAELDKGKKFLAWCIQEGAS